MSPATWANCTSPTAMFSRSKTTQAISDIREEMARLRTELHESTQALASERDKVSAVLERLTSLEVRVSGMGTELARQIHELGNEIEELSRRAEDGAVSEIVDAIRNAQARLAAEQARYAITFRQDLATLADQLLRRVN